MKSNLISTAIRTTFLSAFFLLVPLSLVAQDEDSLSTNVDSIDDEEIISPFESYFEPLSSSEAQAQYDAINTNGLIEDVNSVTNTRELNGGLVTDPHYLLTTAGKDTLNRILKMVETETGFQMAVVCVNSIGDKDPTTWAHDLFNLWGIGNADADNGFLCVVINDIHRVEFANGYGTEVVLTDAQGEDIRQNEMIPHFRNNDYTTGVVRGMQVVADVFYGIPPDYYSYSTDDNSTDYEYDYETPSSSSPSTPFWEWKITRLYFVFAILLSLAFALVLMLSFFMRDLHKRYNTVKFFSLLIFPILFPVPFLLFHLILKKLMTKWRNTERFSGASGEFMVKLNEVEDDKHLKKGQVTEEIIKSIDYDVWVTQDRSEVLVLAYKRWFSKYRKCPSCKHKTYYKEYDRVISAASYTSSGTGQRKYSCKNCSHTKITTYTIPKKQASSGGSSSGGYSSGGYSSGSSGGSSSSSSSSGGSSFGGGSSGGGGGGSSW